MPPPPGLNEIHVRSLEDLQLKFLKLRIDSPDMGPDHVPLPLHWWLLVGIGFIALVMTGNLARRGRLEVMRIAHPILRQGPRFRGSALLAKETRTQYATILHSILWIDAIEFLLSTATNKQLVHFFRLVRPSSAAHNEQFHLPRLDLRVEDIVSMRHAAQIVSEAIASGNDQEGSIGLRSTHAPRIGGYVEEDEVEGGEGSGGSRGRLRL